MGVETEIKLATTPEMLARLLKDPRLADMAADMAGGVAGVDAGDTDARTPTPGATAGCAVEAGALGRQVGRLFWGAGGNRRTAASRRRGSRRTGGIIRD